MKAFAVSVNGKPLWTVGIGPNGVFNVIVACTVGIPLRAKEHFNFSVGGLDTRTDEHVRWKTPALKVGDSVTVDLIEVEEFDSETSRFKLSDMPAGKKPRPKPKGRARSKTKKAKLKRKVPKTG